MQLNYIMVATPDKISLNTFLRFIRKAVGKDYAIGEMHSLMTEKDKDQYTAGFIAKHPKGLISYYARGVKKIENPNTCLPIKMAELADCIVWFDLYSTSPIVVKDTAEFLPPVIQNWFKYVESLNF